MRHALDVGFTLDAIRQLRALADRRPRNEPMDGVVREQLVDVNRRLTKLAAVRTELERMLAECEGGTVGQCRILEVLNNHSLCLTPDRGDPDSR